MFRLYTAGLCGVIMCGVVECEEQGSVRSGP